MVACAFGACRPGLGRPSARTPVEAMSFSAADGEFMARALELARRGLYTTTPNPRVGCVIVRDGAVIGEGWHEMAGQPHAEVNALADVARKVGAGATAIIMPVLSSAAAWAVLLVAGLCEVGWAIGLKYTEGFTRLIPSAWTLVAMGASVVLLAWSLKTLPVGTAYAVWTGIGAVGTAVLGMLLFGESREVARLVCIGLIVAGILGLKLVTK